MPIGDYQTLMLPTLKALAGGAEAPLGEIRKRVAVSGKLTDEEVSQKLPSGRQTVLANRVSWALLGMERAGLVQRVRRAVYRLTDEGGRLLSRDLERVDDQVLATYPAFAEWKKRERQPRIDPRPERDRPPETPEGNPDPRRQRDARNAGGRAIGPGSRRGSCVSRASRRRSAALHGLWRRGRRQGARDRPYRRWRHRRHHPGRRARPGRGLCAGQEIRRGQRRRGRRSAQLRGAIDAAGTTKGVFVTTARFTKSAKDYVDKSPKRIVLIDGDELARLMVRHNVGVRTRDRYEIKGIDEDYFDQDGL